MERTFIYSMRAQTKKHLVQPQLETCWSGKPAFLPVYAHLQLTRKHLKYSLVRYRKHTPSKQFANMASMNNGD